MTPAQQIRDLRQENAALRRRITYLESREATSAEPCETAEEYRRRLMCLRAHIGRIGREVQCAGDVLVRLLEDPS